MYIKLDDLKKGYVSNMQIESIFTIDVEEYYHICGDNIAPPVSEWDELPVTVEKNLYTLLDIFNQYNVKTTCFFLGYLAKKHPHLVKAALDQGHEIASHGMYHQVINQLTLADFTKDITDSKHLLEDIAGQEVQCYRSPSFSVLEDDTNFFDLLINAGYRSDSSVFPAKRSDGGSRSSIITPHWISTSSGRILEFPVTVSSVLGKNICFFGGGYLRLFPIQLILRQAMKLKEKGIPVLYYIHPREIDPAHPKLIMKPLKKFKTYVNLPSVRPKLNSILQSSTFITIADYYKQVLSGEINTNEK